MRKRIIALLLALILTVGLLPTVALAAEETANNDVVPGSIGTDGKWSQTPPTQPKVDGVKTVDKTAEKVAGTDNQYKVTLTVVLEQTKEEQKPGAAATVLVLDTSGSMAYCAECGAEEECEHSCEAFDGQVVQNGNYYYKNDKGEYKKAYYCDGKHIIKRWLKHPAGWFTTSGGDSDHKPKKDSLAGRTMYVKSETPRASRLDAAKTAAQNFLRIYSGLKFDNNGNLITGQTARNLGRYVSVVTFATGVTLQQNWIDVSNPAGYESVLGVFTGNSLKAEGGTNLDAGLTYAEYLLKKNTMKDAAKNVIALTDGEPTYYLSTSYFCNDPECDDVDNRPQIGEEFYYVHGRGDACSTNTKSATDNAANALKNNNFSDLYTICFGVANDKMKQYKDGNSIKYWPNSLTVGQYLQSIASSKAGKQFAYTADNAAQLNTAFAAITDTIVSGLDTGTVNDTLPTGITGSTATANGQAITSPMTWKLDDDDFDVSTNTETEGDKTVTTYTYTKTYYVTINPDAKGLKTTKIGGDLYAPLNGETTLTVEVAGEEKTIPFPIPAGKVTPTTFTVTWKSQDGEQTYETDNNVARNSKPSYDGATPTKAEDDMYTYTFVGWATSANQDTGTPEADLPSVIDNVTYYAAFSKTQKTYTVTGTIDNGTVNNKASTDTQTVNAGGSSAAMTFTPATGYKIVSVKEKVGEVETTITDFAETGYTYPVKNDIRANITVDVKTAKRDDLSYTVRYLEKGTTNEIRTADTVNGQEFSATITGDSINHPAITGFIYDSCSPESITIGTDSAQNVITLYYTRNSYTVTFKDGANGAVFVDELQQVEYGKNIPSHDNPVRPGYNFTGWTSEPANYQPGTGTMPANNITFTAQWTEKGSVTINYVAKTGGSVTPTSEALNPDTGEATGSTAKANDGYRFVGWYSDETCTTAVPAAWVDSDNKLTPGKPEGGWADATYYAKFEAIPTPGADDLPTVTVQCTNGQASHQQSSGKPLVAGTYNTSAVSKDTATGKYTCTITLTGKSDYITPYNTETNETHEPEPQNDVTEVTMTYNETTKTWSASSVFVINVKCDTPTVNVTYEWTGLKGVVFDDDQHKAPTLPKGETVPKGSPHTVDFMYLNGSTVTDVHGNVYKFSGWDKSDTFTVQKNTTIRGTWTKSTGTFELDGKIFKSFTAPDDVQKDFYVTVTPQQGDTTDIRTGIILSLTGSTTTDVQFNFYNRSRITFTEPNTYTYLVEETFDREAHPNGIVDEIHYDTKQYLLTIQVDETLNVVAYSFTVMPEGDTPIEAVPDGAQTITFKNTYNEDPNADDVTLDLSKYVTKTFESRHGKSATETFKARVEIWVKNPEIIVTAAEENAIAVYDSDPVNGTVVYDEIGTVTLSTGEKASFTFATNPKLDRRYAYAIRVTEVAGNNTDVEYDKTVYESRFGFYDTKEIQWLEGTSNFSFTNTYTGIDDYYPIIIPTIINKDTGMLNKTDHFAYVIGYPDGTVHPNGQITRAEVATIFFRLLRDEVRDGAFTTSNSYSDVAYGKWYNNPISTMSALGIITGYPDGTFKPNKPITRAEFAAIAARFDETQSGKSATFSDVIGHWAAKEIGIAYYNDWIKGYPDGTFKPDQNITRAEAMTLINRVLERKPESPADLLTNMNKWTDNLDTSKWYYLDVQEATNSHGYTRKTFNYELWRQMLPDPDWSRYER